MKYSYLPEAHGDFVWAVMGSPWELAAIYLAAINLVTFLAFGVDKRRAKRKETRGAVRRVPERTLFLLAALGGSVGALLGMRVWRHKTLHRTFRFGIPAILVLQVALCVGLWLWCGGNR